MLGYKSHSTKLTKLVLYYLIRVWIIILYLWVLVYVSVELVGEYGKIA